MLMSMEARGYQVHKSGSYRVTVAVSTFVNSLCSANSQ